MEGVKVLKVQNIEIRDHLNLTIDMLNNVTTILNNQYENKEQTDEAIQTETTTPHEDTQHILKKVYAMYEVTTPHEDMAKIHNPLYNRCSLCIKVNHPTKKDGMK